MDATLAAVRDVLWVSKNEFLVQAIAPENFLFEFRSQAARDRVFSAGRVPIGTTQLIFKPWTRVARAVPDTLFFKLRLEIDGIPPHARNMATPKELLSSYCWIECPDPATESRANLSCFWLTAWTDDSACIPAEKKLKIAELEATVECSDDNMKRRFTHLTRYLMRKKVLSYDVRIRFRNITDFTPRSPSTSPGGSPPSDDDDSGHDSHPDRGYGKSRGTNPHFYNFPPKQTPARSATVPPPESKKNNHRRRQAPATRWVQKKCKSRFFPCKSQLAPFQYWI